jgi:DNA-binding XRE family transcriptional regulator
MTQQELAEHIGLSKQTVSRYVNNSHVMSYQTALNIARVLKCQMEDLYEIREQVKVVDNCLLPAKFYHDFNNNVTLLPYNVYKIYMFNYD